MKTEPAVVSIQEFVGLIKMYSFLVEEKNENKKAKSVNRNVVAAIIHNEHQYVLLNNKCM